MINNFYVLIDYNEFTKISFYKDIFKKIEDAGYVVLIGIDYKYGEEELKTAFIFIRTIEDFSKNKINFVY